MPVRLEVKISICSVMRQLGFKSGDFNEDRRGHAVVLIPHGKMGSLLSSTCYHPIGGKDLKSWMFVNRVCKSGVFQQKLHYMIQDSAVLAHAIF